MQRLRKIAKEEFTAPPEIGGEVYEDELPINLNALSKPENRDEAIIVQVSTGEIHRGNERHSDIVQDKFNVDKHDDEGYEALDNDLAYGSLINLFGAQSIIFYHISSDKNAVINIVEQQMPGTVMYEEDYANGVEFLTRIAKRCNMSRLKKISELENGTFYAYHSTPIENVNSINQDGLLANNKYSDGSSLSLGFTFDSAEEWGYLKGAGAFVVVKIKLTSKDIEELKRFSPGWKEFFKNYMINTIAPREHFDVSDIKDGSWDFNEFLEELEDHLGKEYHDDLEQEAFEKFAEENELNLPYDIPPSQIVSISKEIGE